MIAILTRSKNWKKNTYTHTKIWYIQCKEPPLFSLWISPLLVRHNLTQNPTTHVRSQLDLKFCPLYKKGSVSLCRCRVYVQTLPGFLAAAFSLKLWKGLIVDPSPILYLGPQMHSMITMSIWAYYLLPVVKLYACKLQFIYSCSSHMTAKQSKMYLTFAEKGRAAF
jgi:hypothetical protein